VWCAWSSRCESESCISGAHGCSGQWHNCFRCQGVVCILVFLAREAVVEEVTLAACVLKLITKVWLRFTSCVLSLQCLLSIYNCFTR
jgi:hypothetical protein